MLTTVFTLLIAYQLKHFVADFLLQGKYMLGKFKPGWDFVLPLSAHCGVHALLTLIIVWQTNQSYWWLAIVDFVVHFIMDRIKASPKMLGRYTALSKAEMVRIMKFQSTRDPSDFNPECLVYTQGDLERKEQLRSNILFWWSLGFDQMVHSLTHYFIIFMLVKDMNEFAELMLVGVAVFTAPLWIPIALVFTGVMFYFVYKLALRSIKDL